MKKGDKNKKSSLFQSILNKGVSKLLKHLESVTGTDFPYDFFCKFQKPIKYTHEWYLST